MSLKFVEKPLPIDKKTKVWNVLGSNNFFLGDIRWHAPWRNYCYFPCDRIIMDKSCLREVADFCECESKALRAAWGKKKKVST